MIDLGSDRNLLPIPLPYTGFYFLCSFYKPLLGGVDILPTVYLLILPTYDHSPPGKEE